MYIRNNWSLTPLISTLTTRTLAAVSGVGGNLFSAAGGVLNIVDLAVDTHIASTPILRHTSVGRESTARVEAFQQSTRDVVSGTVNYLSQDDLGSALRRDTGLAVAETSNYLSRVFVEGDLTATSSWSGAMFDIAAGGAIARTARTGRAGASGSGETRLITESQSRPGVVSDVVPDSAATRARVEANIAESRTVREASGFSTSRVAELERSQPGRVPNNKAQYVYDARAGRYRETATGQFAAARNLPWPDNAGFASSAKQTVQPGTIVDRYGSQTGRFLGEPGATVSQRGMAQGSDAMPYTQYRVIKPFDAQVGPAAPVPAFGASGGATQYLPGRTVEQLVQDGFLEVIK